MICDVGRGTNSPRETLISPARLHCVLDDNARIEQCIQAHCRDVNMT